MPRAKLSEGIPAVSSEEVLLDASRRYAVEARKAGAPITLELWLGMHHAFQLDAKTRRELAACARPRGSFFEKWNVTVSDLPLASRRSASARRMAL